MNEKSVDRENNSDNERILYITGVIIFLLVILWIIMIIFTRDNSINIIGEMNKIESQVTLAV